MEPLKFLGEMLEIIGEDLAQTQVSDIKYGGQFNYDRLKRKSRDELGRGAFSKVTPDREDPHMVQKKSVTPLGPKHSDKADGFNAFVNMLIDNNLMDDIHFPKIYRAQTVTDKNGTKRHNYTIEKLEPISKLSRQEMATLEETHMNPGYDEDFPLWERIFAACRSSRARETYIRMDSLKESCQALEDMDDYSDFRLDIHADNLMVRRTPHGLQLVFSDPFGMIKSSELYKYQ